MSPALTPLFSFFEKTRLEEVKATENNSQASQKKPTENDTKNKVELDDLLPTLNSLMSDAKAKAKQNEIYFSKDMYLTVWFCISTFIRAMNGNPRHLDESDKNIILILRHSGCNSNEIAYAVNRSKGAVIAHLKELDKVKATEALQEQ